jgi:uncharacterized protein YbjT (DUF2867 family)
MLLLTWLLVVRRCSSGERHGRRAIMKIAVAGATGRVGRPLVEVLAAGGHDVVAMSRSQGVDVATGAGLADALAGAACVIDVATGSSEDQAAATAFFRAAAGNLQQAGARAGVREIVMVSIIGVDRFTTGYLAAKLVHERAMLDGPIPVRILRAAQFHEFVAALIDWGRRGDVSYLPNIRSQLVAARNVAEALADLATGAPSAPAPIPGRGTISEIGGPRPENLVDMAKLLVDRRGDRLKIEAEPGRALYDTDDPNVILPGPGALLVGPTFEEWLSRA